MFADADGHHAAGLGAPVVLVDPATGTVLRVDRPGRGRAGDLLLQLSRHGGRLLVLPGRILIAVTGLVVPMLVVTGVIIWHRRRRTASRTRHS